MMEEKVKNPTKNVFTSIGLWVCILAVVAILVVAAVMLLKPAEVPPTFTEGEETGIYYYESVLGEYTITLNSGIKFTIAGPDLNKSGEYKVSEGTLTLDFVKDEDGTAQATLNGDELTLVYKETTMTFLKKVNYTVTFDTDGGSAVDAITVINGKTVLKPNDPVKEGNIFLGWYSNAELTEAFLFGTTPVTENITLYAKWAAVVAGQDEYVVDFDLGYEGAASWDSISTVGGKIVFGADYKAPVREGYTFVGWFISAYEQADKLTYAAAEGTALSANTTLFAVWHDNATTTLASPKVSVVGNTVSWEMVDGASSYVVVITDSQGNTLFNQSVGTFSQTFEFSAEEPGDYVVSVVAKGTNAADSAPTVRYYKNKALDRVSKFEIVGTTLIFNTVANAEKYLITIDCGNDDHNHTLFNNGNSTNYNFANCPMQAGGIAFTVTAVANGYADSVSETFYYVRNLDKVGEIVYDEATATFKWASVANASKYYVIVTCADHTHAIVDNGNATTYTVKNCTGEITLSVVPANDGFNSPEAASVTVTKKSPATPENIKVVGMNVSWDDAAGAKSYIIKVNGTSYNVSGTTYNLTDTGIAFNVGEKYTITVQTIGETENSIVSEVYELVYIAMGNVSYNNNTVTWDNVLGASRYDVRVNGGDIVTVSGTNSAKVALTKAGINVIEVRPTDFAASVEWKSVEVFAYEIVYNTRSSNGSVYEYLAKGDTMSLPTTFEYPGFDFTGWYNAPGAAQGNGGKYTETVFNGYGDTVLYANWSPKSYNIEFVGIDANMTGAATGDKVKVVYTEHFKLPVLTTTDTVKGNFAGWYTGPGGTGTKLTDYLGNSVAPYSVTTDSYAYPYFTSGLVFELKDDNTYAVKKGTDIDTIPVVTIPAYYNGVAVTTILENGFYNCDRLVEINIPDTIQLIGTGALAGCDALVSINVYEVETETPHEVFYASHDGALLFTDVASGYTYLEVFPRAKKGSYTVPAEVDVIRNRAFNYAKISSLTISNEVLTISDYAFSNCRTLREVIFEEGGTAPISVSSNAFYGCTSVTYIKLPALIKGSGEETPFSVFTLDSLTALQTIEVEKVAGAYFSAVEGMLCNELGDKILYCPRAYTGLSGVLTIPKGITAIGDGTFSGRNAFTAIIIPNYVTEIGSSAFANCRNVAKITIEGSRSRDLVIKSSAFANCASNREVFFEGNGSNTVDLGKVTIGSGAFTGQTELRTFTVENGANIASIGDSAFAANLKLRTITIGEGATVTEIGANAFKGCEGLTSFTIPASTVSIGSSAFADCTFLSKIIFAPNGQNIDFGSYVFQNCVGLTSVELPATVQSFDGSAFDGCYSLTNIVVDPANTYLTTINGILYDKNITEIMFYPKGINDPKLENLPWDTLTKIGNTVFKDNTNITEIVIPKTITKIGDSAFNGCVNLTSIEFEEGGTTLSIGKYAFGSCQQLFSLELPEYTTSIAEGLFYLTPLKNFEIPSGVTSIGQKAFMYTNITSATIPASVTVIGDGAFAHSKLSSITFEEGETPLKIGDIIDINISYDFESDNYNLLKAAKVFPTDYIGKDVIGVFVGTSIKKLNIPARATSIGALAFYNITTLTSSVTITADSNLKTIGDGAFYGSYIPGIQLENTKLEVVGEFAFSETRLTSVKFPNTITTIEKYSFADVGKISGSKITPTLASVEFVTGGTNQLSLFRGAFKNSTFTTITLPKTFTAYGDKVYVGSTDPTYAVYMRPFYRIFEGNAKLAAVNVEEGNPLYMSVDGVFYEKDGNGDPGILVYCPTKKTGEYTVPKTVTYVEHRAFYLTQLTKLSFENFVEGDANYGQQTLEIGSGNTAASPINKWSVIGGVTQSSSSTTLLTTRSILYNYSESASKIYNKEYVAASTLTQINFPAHIKLVASFAVFGIKTTGFSVNFDENSSPVKFNKKAIFENEGLTVLNLPKIESLSTDSYTANTFAGNKKLTTVTFAEGSTFTLIPESTFFNCLALTSIEIPASVTYIDKQAFSGCKALTSITFEEGSQIAGIGASALKDTAITSFVIPDTVTFMGPSVFAGCPNLKTVTIGLGLSSVVASDANGSSTSVFESNTSIEEIIVPKNHTSLTAVDGVLYDLTMSILYAYPVGKTDAHFEMPLTVKEIASYAFAYYQGTTINLSANLTKIGRGAFYQSKLTEVFIPASVTVIEANAFSCNSSTRDLAKITFAENSQLNYIGNSAFYYTSFETIDIPDNVTYIGSSCFFYNQKLKSVTLSAALQTLDHSAFSSCSGLETVTIQNSLTTIGVQAFYNCTKLAKVDLPQSLTTIAYSAFYGASGLEYVTFAEGSRLNAIGYQAFYNCASLKEIVLPEGLSDIGYSVFYGCKSLEMIDMSKTQFTTLNSQSGGFFNGCSALKTVYLPETLESIGSNSFSGCSSLLSVSIPASVTTIGSGAFSGCSKLASVEFAEDCVITSIEASAFSGTSALKSIELPRSITSIGGSAFSSSGITSIEIPENVTVINASTFYGCRGLTEVTIPATVTDINASAFANCTNIEVLNLTDGLEFLGAGAFNNCTSIKEIIVPATVLRMDGNPFSGCSGLENFDLAPGNEAFVLDEAGVLYDINMRSIIFYPLYLETELYRMPSTVFELSEGVFAGTKIKNAIISDSIKVIPNNCFQNCKQLESVVIPLSVISIGNNAFSGCAKLDSVAIPGSCTNVGSAAFANCTSLTSFDFGERNAEIVVGSSLFSGCTSLTDVIVPEGMAKLPANMFAGTGIVDVVLPDTVTDLSASGIFKNCKALESIVIPEDYEGIIGAEVFYGCSSLKSIVLPEGVELLGDESWGDNGATFMNCTSLESVTFGSALYWLGPNSFYGCTSLKSVDMSETSIGATGRYTFAYCTSLEEVKLSPDFYDLGYSDFEGCTALKSVDMSYCYVWFYGGFFKDCTGLEELHLGDIDFFENYGYDGQTWGTGWGCGNFEGLTSKTKIYFDNYTWEDALYFFEDHYGAMEETFPFLGCEARVFDCDGNEFIYDGEELVLIKVVSPDGEVLYEG